MNYEIRKELDGLTGNAILRQRAINNYYEAPNYCKHCGSVIKIYVGEKPSETRRKKFCNSSCSASFNNKIPKRKLKRICSVHDCKETVKSHKYKYCSFHWEEVKKWKREELKRRTLGEYRERLSVKDKHPSWLHAGVRGLNRNWNKHLSLLPCKNCGYTKHVELCHIRAVSDFPDSATLGEVNSIENNIPLCPNCHWELDNGLLNIGDIV